LFESVYREFYKAVIKSAEAKTILINRLKPREPNLKIIQKNFINKKKKKKKKFFRRRINTFIWSANEYYAHFFFYIRTKNVKDFTGIFYEQALNKAKINLRV